jgi:polyisoprenoid-binding protein YceI
MVEMLKMIIGGVLALVAVVAIGSGVWWFFVREENELATSAPEVPSDLVNASPTAGSGAGDETPAPSGSGQVYVIIPDRSEAAYFADEQLASLPLPSTAKGSTNDITGTFYLTEDGTGLDPEQVSSFTVDLTTLTSNESRRDNRVQSDALQTSQFPTATFTASSVTGHDPSIAEGEEQALMLTGILDLHGVQKEVTWDVLARREGDVITALATLKDIPYSDFNITPPNIAGFVSVEDDVTLQVQIVAQRS